MKSCPVCGSGLVRKVLEIKGVPVYCNVLLRTREEALRVPKGDISLAHCNCCGHVFNAAFDADLLEYTPDYENSLHWSPRFQQYAEDLAADLISRYDLRGKRIIEIACGKGDFLKLLCQPEGNRGVGFDPSSEIEGQDGNVTFVRDYFGRNEESWQADFVCCRHALEHISQPTAFLQGIKEIIGPFGSSALFFEVPNGLYTFRDMGIWDLIYEHCSYFWAGSLRRAFDLASLRVTRLGVAFDEQFLAIEAYPDPQEQAALEISGLTEMERDIDLFEKRYRQKTLEWRGRLGELRSKGFRVAVWGAGSKGVTFLNVLRSAGMVDFVVDVNPRKKGRFVPGSAQEVISPVQLAEVRPDVIIVMNSIYREEISRTISAMGLGSIILEA
jgi:hypothetical protein